MSAWHRIEMALKSLGLDEKYLSKFIENKIDDELLQECLQDPQQLSSFSEIIPVVGDRIRFFKAYNSIDVSSTACSTTEVSSIEGLPAKPSSDVIDLNNLTPRPIQIMDFEEPRKNNGHSKIIFHQQIFKQILMKTKTDNVAVISIAGPSRKGKSFFLNFVLRYLSSTKNNNNMSWMQNDDLNERLDGFTWKTSTNRVTKGIWLWSEPFQMKSTSGDDFDLLIMDTQGVFDEHTSMREWSILVGLALLASSCLVFNVAGDIQEDVLLIFEKFLDFGLMALNEDDTTTPFQNLLFLIRDWNVPTEFPYGFIGGREYLQTKLNAKSCHKESHKKIRQQLKDCFEDISCCVLPHPGDEFLQPNFNGFVGQNNAFATEIEKCVTELMDPVKIPLKKINGNQTMKADILQAFSNYCDFFNSEDTLTPESILQLMSRQSNELVVRNCLERFKNELNMQLARRPFFLRNELFDIKVTTMQSCLDIFDQWRIMGDRALLRIDLSRQMEESYQAIKDRNAEHHKIVTSEAFDKASKEFIGIVTSGMPNSYLSSIAMDSLLLESERKVYATFSSHCGVKNIDMIPDEAVKFHEFLISQRKEFKSDNALKKDKAERSLNDVIQKLVAVYVKNMEERSHGRIVSEKQIAELHDIYKKQCVDELNALQVNEDFICEVERNLNAKINDTYKRVYKDVLDSNEKTNSHGNDLVTQAASTYFNSAMANFTAKKGDLKELQQSLYRSAQKTVIDGCPINDGQFLEKLLAQLSNECEKQNIALNDSYERIQREIMTKLSDGRDEAINMIQREIMTKLSDGRDEAINMYKLALTEMLPQNSPVDFETLDDIHGQLMQLSTERFEDVFRQICERYEGVDENLSKNYKSYVVDRIQTKYDSVKQMNELQIKNAEAKAVELLTNAKESYGSRMRKAQQGLLTNEEDLKFVQSGIKKDLSDNLRQTLEGLCLSHDQQENFIENFHVHIEGEFEVILEVCRMKMVENELIIKTAFLDAREFYKDEIREYEIDKHLQSKDWFEVSELEELHKMIVEAAIEKSSDEMDITESQKIQLRELIDNLFKRYQDRNLLRMPIDDYAIGIDLGTTYSCVAVCIQGKVIVISQNEKTTIPSYVAFKDNLAVDVGEAAKELKFRRPEWTIFDAKRLIGRKFSDKIVQDDMKLWPFEVVNSSDQPKIKIPGHSETYFPEQVSARVLAHLKKMAEEFLNKKVKNAVVTVPAYFSESQRQATKDAAQIAGLNTKILNEPTAAAISYELHRTDDFSRNVLIFDLGGGTFDVAVLKMKGGEVIVKAISGDTHLGGEDFGNEMVKYILKVVKEKLKIDLGRDIDSSDPALRHDASVRLRRIRSACEKKKRLLSMSDSVKITIGKVDGTFDLDETFTRAQFEALNMTKFENCIDITAAVISDAEMVKSDIDDIVLIGGSTRIPKIRGLLTQFFYGKALNKQINADEAVAYGAAIQAALIFGKRNEVRKNVHVKDVTPMSLGVEVFDGSMSNIIQKNTHVPCSRERSYCTVRDWQTSIAFDIYEGEKLIAVNNNKLGTFIICDIPKARARQEPIDVTMAIDDEGLLHVKAICRSTGKTEGITIEQHKGRMSVREIQMAQLDMSQNASNG